MPFLLLLLAILGSTGVTHSQEKLLPAPEIFGAMEVRHIGPAAMSGRISALDAYNKDARLIYVGAAGGGIWKSTNAGTTFKPVFEKYPQSIGTITIDQLRPDTVWAGTGETWVRNSVSAGKGIFKTTDGGETWKCMGLTSTERIGKIVISPDKPDVVFAAAAGPLWSNSSERGVFKTTDGGQTWKNVLFVNDSTGASDLVMDPENPDVLFAGMWQFRRTPHSFMSGGKGSGLFKSTDGGETWQKLTRGLPEGETGRISIAISPQNYSLMFALIESEKTGLYRSTNKGEDWELISSSGMVAERPFYFSLIVPDPSEMNIVYKPGMALYVSRDTGKTFSYVSGEGGRYHPDVHALWINPKDNRNLYMGTDGGLYISNDKGSTWNFVQNLPVSQFYHVSADMQKPYNVYGGLQDNGSWTGPSRSSGSIKNSDWKNVGWGDGFHVFPDPKDNNIIYWQWQGGNLVKYYKSSRESKEIKPFAEGSFEKLRFNWNTPVVFSQSRPSVIYTGSQYVYRSTDRGDSWQKISPDLTTNDPLKQKQEESGRLTIDNSSAENHCTVFTICESPLDKNIIWAGTDDGNLQVTSDGGKNWTNTVNNIPGLPASTWCSKVEAGHFNKNTAYAVFDGHQTGDMKPYVFRTDDLGKSWRAVADDNIKGFCRVIKEDPVSKNLLFLGTEEGLFISINAGESWIRFTGKMPEVSVMDMVIHPEESDLILATHGRGVLILDDITPLRQLNVDMLNEELAVLDNKPFIINFPGSTADMTGDQSYYGQNPPEAAQITYYLSKRHVFGDMYVEIYDASGKMLQRLPAGTRKGINRNLWYIRQKPPKVSASIGSIGRVLYGPAYPAGVYQIKIVKGDKVYSGSIELKDDPSLKHSAEDKAAQNAALMKAYHMLEDLSFLVRQTKDLRDKALLKAAEIKGDNEVKNLLQSYAAGMDKINSDLAAESRTMLSGKTRLREMISEIYGALISYMGRPTRSQTEALTLLEKELAGRRSQADNMIVRELPLINGKLKELNINGFSAITRQEYDNELSK